MPIENEVLDIVKNIKPSNKATSFKLISWPYSRDLVSAIFKTKDFNFEYKRLDKRNDEFIVDAEEKVVAKIKKILKLVNKEAKEDGNGSKSRNDISKSLIEQLESNEDEIKNHVPSNDDFLDDEEDEAPKKVIKKKAVKKTEDEEVNSESDEDKTEDAESEEDEAPKKVIKKKAVKKVLRKK